MASTSSEVDGQKDAEVAKNRDNQIEADQIEVALQETGTGSRWLSLFQWDRYDQNKLHQAEKALFSKVVTKISSKFVRIRFWNSNIYTISLKNEDTADKIPFVLLHDLGAGVGIWAQNLDELAQKRPVHAIDLLGFGRSSRPKFSEDATLAELEYVSSIEDWRKSMNIEKMILVGHSLGGYLASSYALEHPSRVKHLVLVDPWGFTEYPETWERHIKASENSWILFVSRIVSYFNPLSSLRIAGPYGVLMAKMVRPNDGKKHFNEAIYEYIYQINARTPAGELAFKSMTSGFMWPKRPMLNRFGGLNTRVPITFIYGLRSFIDSGTGFEVLEMRKNSYVDVRIIPGAGHQVHVDNSDEFNKRMQEISDVVDNEEDLVVMSKPASVDTVSLASNCILNGQEG